jgi:hypothetical protein
MANLHPVPPCQCITDTMIDTRKNLQTKYLPLPAMQRRIPTITTNSPKTHPNSPTQLSTKPSSTPPPPLHPHQPTTVSASPNSSSFHPSNVPATAESSTTSSSRTPAPIPSSKKSASRIPVPRSRTCEIAGIYSSWKTMACSRGSRPPCQNSGLKKLESGLKYLLYVSFL